jgi:transcriptional regulator with PAS, ATPase and Fis domain
MAKPEPTPSTQASVSAEEALRKALAHDNQLDVTVEIIEKAIIDRLFERHLSLRSAANALGIARSTLSQKKVKVLWS